MACAYRESADIWMAIRFKDWRKLKRCFTEPYLRKFLLEDSFLRYLRRPICLIKGHKFVDCGCGVSCVRCHTWRWKEKSID